MSTLSGEQSRIEQREQGRVWVSVGSHRARSRLKALAPAEDMRTSYGVWPLKADGSTAGWARGEYYLVAEGLADQVRRVPGLTVMKARPKGSVFTRL